MIFQDKHTIGNKEEKYEPVKPARRRSRDIKIIEDSMRDRALGE